MKLTVNVSAADNLSMESDSQANMCNHTEVLPATTKLKRKAKFIETIVKKHCLATVRLQFGPHPSFPGLHEKTSISLPRVGEVPHLTSPHRGPLFHVNKPLETSRVLANRTCG